MSNHEKRHRATIQHLRYLKSFMDEIDREVMSLTDRAFKSLCIGDEAIYNDSEFSPSPVCFHKPTVEDATKKSKERSLSAGTNLNMLPLNDANNPLGVSKKLSKDSALFAIASIKNGEHTKMTNGDSWDKSALLSIQKELSEFSSDYHSLTAEHLSQAKNLDKGSSNKSSKDGSIPSGKSLKTKQLKNNKLKKLNCINFFLHSEFSPFLSWREFNTFSLGHEHISEILSNKSPEWYDSPLYKELTAAHGRYTLSLPALVREESETSPKTSETHSCKSERSPLQSTPPSVPQKPGKEKENVQNNIPSKAPSLAPEQRCNSERAEPCAPWRKSRSRAKSAALLGHSFTNSPVCERTNVWEGSRKTFNNAVKTIEDQTSASSTPFSISQLLTPVIPSRHGTGTSEILQTVLSPSLEVPALPEKGLHPSPEIKREGYKSIASSLLFNLKDNRKRVKTMYSPPKFKGSDGTHQNKDSPLSEALNTRLEVPEVSETISSSRQRVITPMSPLLETADAQTCFSPKVPDDYLALSLLQSGKVKSNRSPFANKAHYPSLQLYRKNSSEEIYSNSQTLLDTSPQVCKDKVIKDPGKLIKEKESQNRNNQELGGNVKECSASLDCEGTIRINSRKSPCVSLANLDKPTGTSEMDMLNSKVAQKSPNKVKELDQKETALKRAFSAQQNNYIKSQRFVSSDDDDLKEDCSNSVKDLLIKDKSPCDELSKHSAVEKTRHVKEDIVLKEKALDGQAFKGTIRIEGHTLMKDLKMVAMETQREIKANPETMKGNTSLKRALFASMEQGASKTHAPCKKENVVMDKFDLAKMALEEVIADREQRKLQTKAVSTAESSPIGRKHADCNETQGGTTPLSTENRQVPSEFPSNLTKEVNSQNIVSALKANQQTMSEVMAKHGDVPDVKLARSCKQGDTGQCQHSEPIKHQETDRLEIRTHDDKDCKKHQKKELMNENVSDALKSAKSKDLPESHNVDFEEQCGEKVCVDHKGSLYKPEIPPRRGRSNSQSKESFDSSVIKAEEIEIIKDNKVQTSQSKNKGPVRGNVSALKEKYDKESKMNQKDVQKGRFVGSEKPLKEGHYDGAPKDKIPNKLVPPKLTISDIDNGTYSVMCNDMDSETGEPSIMSSRESVKEEELLSSPEKPSITQLSPRHAPEPESNRNQRMQDKIRSNETKEGDSKDSDKSIKSKGASKSYVKEFLSGLLGLSSSEKGQAVEEHEEELPETLSSSESLKTDQIRKDSITIYDILGNPPSVSSPNDNQSNHESGSSNSSEPSMLNKSESVGQANDLFKNVCRMNETVEGNAKENIQKTMVELCPEGTNESTPDVSFQGGSPPKDFDKRGWVYSLIESARDLSQIQESKVSSKNIGPDICQKMLQDQFIASGNNGELDILKDSSILPVSIPDRSGKSPQPNQPPMHFLTLPVSGKDRKLSAGSISMSEEEECFSAVSTLSEGVESYETSLGDSLEENVASALQSEDVDECKESGDGSVSACSGNDGHGPSKPPVVPPKTEKALRRAMKLTTRRIQKAEAKSKSERKGRSGDKSGSQKSERRHQSDRPEQRSLSSDRISSKHNRELDDELKRQNLQENEAYKQPHNYPMIHTGDSVIHSPEEQNGTSKEIIQEKLGTGHLSDVREGRSNEKSLPKKLERRTQSLDRFLRDKDENMSSHVGKHCGSEISKQESQHSNPKASPMRHNSFEHTYAAAQSFPMTQRKLLQDPDSGQYFLVDMPVQVKTKTFFDPETKSYVQLPVQSPESAVRQAQPLEVMSTPPLVVFHGFVPVPVPSQKSLRTQESVNRLDQLTDFEPSQNGDHSFTEPLYVKQDHTPEEEIDSVR
ncbi:hypothetical protein DNTS_014055 [Danionella cerebrum]|uniref:DUF4585 domain-containing protein n=1 Tax=Danionella cerebrum TaxID=2873325 RepID=A0A553NIG3_9TELE|nr:hypothetical protein DNTS_014055 [Danionella translucida]